VPTLAPGWSYARGEYHRKDGTKLVKNNCGRDGVWWWVHVAGHDTPLPIKHQPHLKRAWKTALSAMLAANKEYPIP
jgi:hypothetical protein